MNEEWGETSYPPLPEVDLAISRKWRPCSLFHVIVATTNLCSSAGSIPPPSELQLSYICIQKCFGKKCFVSSAHLKHAKPSLRLNNARCSTPQGSLLPLLGLVNRTKKFPPVPSQAEITVVSHLPRDRVENGCQAFICAPDAAVVKSFEGDSHISSAARDSFKIRVVYENHIFYIFFTPRAQVST